LFFVGYEGVSVVSWRSQQKTFSLKSELQSVLPVVKVLKVLIVLKLKILDPSKRGVIPTSPNEPQIRLKTSSREGSSWQL
jgi:hypothetical protein